MADRVLRVGEIARYRLAAHFAWTATVVESICVRDDAGEDPPRRVPEVDLAAARGLLVWFRCRNHKGVQHVLVRTESSQGAVSAQEVRVPGEGMVDTEVWSGGKVWSARLWEGGKVRIDPVIDGQILMCQLQEDGTLRTTTEIVGLPDQLLDDVAWALDYKMGGPRWRRTMLAPMALVDSSFAPAQGPGPSWEEKIAAKPPAETRDVARRALEVIGATKCEHGLPMLCLHCEAEAEQFAARLADGSAHAEPPDETARAVLRDLLGRLGMTVRAAKLKDATADDLRAELLRVLKGEALARAAEEIETLKGQRDLEDRNRQAAHSRHTSELDEIAQAAGVKFQSGVPWLTQILAAIEALKDSPAPAAGGFELAQPVKGRGKGKALPATISTDWLRERMMQLAGRCGANTELLGVNGAGVEEIEAAIVACVPELLPEVEIACPHCQGGLLISPELLKPEVAE